MFDPSLKVKLKTTDMETKFTTVALKENQHLELSDGNIGMFEAWMIGFTDGKRDKSLDGYYIISQLKELASLNIA